METEQNAHKVIAQNWDEYDQDGWDPSPETFTSYHMSLGHLGLYAAALKKVNEDNHFIIFEHNGVAYETTVDDETYELVRKNGNSDSRTIERRRQEKND